MRSGIEGVHEPGPRADRGADAEAVVLGVDEGLEVVEDDRLVDRLEAFEGLGLDE
jgi:hypothetical protein